MIGCQLKPVETLWDVKFLVDCEFTLLLGTHLEQFDQYFSFDLHEMKIMSIFSPKTIRYMIFQLSLTLFLLAFRVQARL
jgi:hypothetical protein